MSIGTTIKKLRRERNMTQEELAEILGLTPAAVSGWECDRNAPDISQLPLLSSIFHVSADVLLGIDLSAQEEKIDKIIEKAGSCTSKEAVEIYRTALSEFPSSYELMLHLADNLDYSGEDETLSTRMAEQISLYERIRTNSNDDYLKNCVAGRLCEVHIRQGKREEAVKIAESLPRLSYTRDGLDLMLSQGMDRVHMMHHRIHGKFADLCDDMYFFSMVQADGKPFFTHEQAITILEKIPRLHEIFYENGDYLDTSWIFAWSYTRIAEHYADMGEGEKSVRYLKSAAEYARAMDEYLSGLSGGYCYTDEQDLPKLPMEKRHTSILASPEFDYPTCVNWYRPDAEESYVERLKKDLSHPRFDFIRGELDGLSL